MMPIRRSRSSTPCLRVFQRRSPRAAGRCSVQIWDETATQAQLHTLLLASENQRASFQL